MRLRELNTLILLESNVKRKSIETKVMNNITLALEYLAKYSDAYVSEPETLEEERENERTEDRAHEYLSRYQKLIKQNTITIYRAVQAPKDKLNLEAPGYYWSLEEGGAGVFGTSKYPDADIHYIEAEVNPKHIDWLYGLVSFAYYGENQWEAPLDDNGAVVRITKINDEELPDPVVVTTAGRKMG